MLWPLKCRLLEDISTKSMLGFILVVQWFIGQVLGDRIPMYGTPMGEIFKKSPIILKNAEKFKKQIFQNLTLDDINML